MRLAWFRPVTHVSDRLDDTGALVDALGSEHEIAVFDEARAHDFIRLDFRAPFDLCIFELADTPAHAFVWPYLMHVPGVLRLRSLSLHASRTEALRRQHREPDRVLELALDWDLAAAPILASRMTVVSDAYAVARLRRAFPEARVGYAPLGLNWGLSPSPTPSLSPSLSPSPTPSPTPIVGSFFPTTVVRRAVDRARDAGAQFTLMTDASAEQILDTADIVIAARWPPSDEMTVAIATMAAAKPVIVMENEQTAGWPALDPQTWQPRGWTGEPPIAVSIDPRDEEHSLALALRRLSSDPLLRDQLGTAAHAWWEQHATLDHAVRAWQSIIAEAAALPPPPRPRNWPQHLSADGTERARELLAEFGATVDFL